jgi:hypothetical protein
MERKNGTDTANPFEGWAIRKDILFAREEKAVAYRSPFGIGGCDLEIRTRYKPSIDGMYSAEVIIHLAAPKGKLDNKFRFPKEAICGSLLTAKWGTEEIPGWHSRRLKIAAPSAEEATDGALGMGMAELIKLRELIDRRDPMATPFDAEPYAKAIKDLVKQVKAGISPAHSPHDVFTSDSSGGRGEEK